MASGSAKAPKKNLPDDEDFIGKLADRIGGMIGQSDSEEEARRRCDRVGVNIYYGRHWNVPMPKGRAALVINVAKSLVDHKIAIMTKQLPIPVVQADDVGDVEAARIMRMVLQQYWRKDRMMLKSRNALLIANTSRTVASKTYWDPDKKGGIGDITTDIIPGYRLILDPRTRDVDRMEYAGDRAWMPRTRAMKLYPQAAEAIAAVSKPSTSLLNSQADSPLEGNWKKPGGVDTGSTGAAIINGKPVITAFTGRGSPTANNDDKACEIVELYWRDRALIEREVPVTDSLGNPQQKMKTDESGMPQFKRTEEWDDILDEPGYELEYEEVMETKMAPKYPYYRRTTMVYPDKKVIDDIAWDAPLPYELLSDQPSLEGPWDKGSILECEDLQATINISASCMLDNLRFSAFRAFKKTSVSTLQQKNLVISPGEIIEVGNSPDALTTIDFPELSQAWFPWLNAIIGLMERIIGASGVMQGEATGRVDSAQGYDMLAEIGGSRIVECTQRFEEWIGRLMAKVGWYAQRYYTEEHAVRVEDYEGQLTWERAASAQLMGTFTYHVVTGSTLAWNESSTRGRVLEEFNQGLRDKISVWQKLGIEDWQMIKKRIESQPPQFNPPPPPRMRQTPGKTGKAPHAPRPHG